jgi:adenylyl- and sulfurtransferase ThiI
VTETLDSQIQRIKERIGAAQREQAKAQHQRDAAVATVRESMAALAREFGVTTIEEAHSLLTTLETDLAAQVRQIQAALDSSPAT